jgi:poly(3-hydroxybutyrate) depolymerase
MTHRGVAVDPGRIRHTALLTIEGENDDISGVGQTQAAHRLCTGIPADDKVHYLQHEVGHYGVFNGSRYRAEIAPRIRDFIRAYDLGARGARKNGNGAGRNGFATHGKLAVASASKRG